MGAVEDPGSAGGGGKQCAGEGTERLQKGREEGGKGTFEPSGPGLGRELGGDPGRGEGGGLWAGPPGLEWRGICWTAGPRGSSQSWRCSSSGRPGVELC